MPAKVLFIVFDGLGDRPHPAHGGKTPLETARTPTLDALVRRAATGLLDPLGPGIVPGSGVGHLALFGYDPFAERLARGPLEALGLGLSGAAGDVAIRCNFVTADAEGTIGDRRAGRFRTRADCDEAADLVAAMNKIHVPGLSSEFHYHWRAHYRFVLLLRGAGSAALADTDPGKTGAKRLPARATAREAEPTADRLERLLSECRKVLVAHPANEARKKRGAPPATDLVTRGAGTLSAAEPFPNRYGLSAACIAGGIAYRGIARYVGMDLLECETATGELDTDVSGKVRVALEGLRAHEFVFLHFKGTDICGEDGDFAGKVAYLERADAALRPVASLSDTLVVVTSDHSTPCIRKTHSADPVPVMMSGPNVLVDDVERFTERACAKGYLGRLPATRLMPMILDAVDRTKKVE
ncbi:MAG: 2,3-bisphosphoglycerate-independent phosphoglycerate mutase [Methanobacteriota archaeon]